MPKNQSTINQQPDPKPTKNSLAALAVNPTDVHFEYQRKDEKVVLLLRHHWVTNVPWLLITLVMVMLPPVLLILDIAFGLSFTKQVPANYQKVAVIIWYMISSGYAFASFLSWFFNVSIVTNRRIVDVDYWGVLFHAISDCHLSQIQDITHDIQGAAEIFFNYGDVYVQTAAEVGQFEFTSIPRPHWVHQKIAELVERAKSYKAIKI